MNDQDKSKQELIEELAEMRRLEAQWRSVVANTPVFVYLTDRAGTIRYINHTAYGHSWDVAIGKSAYDFMEPDYREIARGCIERVFDTGQTAFYESRVADPNGDNSWYETHASPIASDDQVVAVLLVSNDITQRRRAEEALFEAQEVARLGFYVLDIAAGRWTSSPVLDRILGIPADYEKTVDGWAHLVHPDERQEMLDHLLKEVVEERKPCDREYRIVRYGDKQVRWVHGLGRLQFNADGQPVSLLGIIQDITERKLAEQALQQAHDELEQRVKERTAELATANEHLEIFRRFAEDAEEGMGMSDFDGRIVYANPTLCRLCGEEKPEDMIGKTVFTYFSEEYKQRRRDELIPALLREGHLHIEHTLLPRHGKPIQILQSTFLIRDKDGNPFRTAVVISDVTQRKQAEEALRQSEEKYRTLVEMSPDAVIMADLGGHITLASQRAVALYGAERVEELLGRNPLEFFAPEDHQRFLGNLQRTLDEGVTRDVEYTLLRKDGSRFFGEASAAAIREASGKPTGFVAIVRDITARKQAEEALRQSHDELQAMNDGMFDGLLIVDLESKRFVRANASICQILGYSEAELLSMSVMDIHPAAEVPVVLERIQARVEGRFQGHTDTRLLRKDGGVRYADVVASRIIYLGRPGMVGFFRDITERKRAEEALQHEYQNLKHLLHASDHERQLIAYDIHDGLAQELAGAIMQLQAFDHLKDKTPKDAAKAYDAAMTMLRQGHSETRRLIAGVRPPILDEEGIVAAVGHLVHEQIRLKGPEIEYHSRVTFDRLDPTLENAVYRIAQEALTNACKHSKSKKVSVSLLQTGDHLSIEVRDWGIGFDPKAVPKKHFGLEGIRQRARLLGGKCGIQSKAGKGTRITVELPVVPRDEEG